MTLTLPAKGSCQCGNVTYQVVEQPLAMLCCHCKDCQKLTASSFSLTMLLNRTGFELLGGELKSWERKADSGNRVHCVFCPTCGNRIYHENPNAPDILRFKPGTLDDTSELRPQVHIWTSREHPWHAEFNDLPRIEGQPDIAAAVAALRAGEQPF